MAGAGTGPVSRRQDSAEEARRWDLRMEMGSEDGDGI
jgi:hypothetical protein